MSYPCLILVLAGAFSIPAYAKKEGKHTGTKKPIKPLAPSINMERFTDVAKVEKNFTEHCYDLHDRDCRAYEKGNFITYLTSIK